MECLQRRPGVRNRSLERQAGLAVVEISKYAFEILRTDGELNLYRGRGPGELRPILVVAPVFKRPDPEVVRRLEHEYSLLEGLELDCAPKPLSLVRHEGRTMLVLEDPGPGVVELDRSLGQPMELGRFLRIATNLAAGLSELHRRGLIHKDIKPAHILVDPITAKVWFTGFGIASQLPRERQIIEPPEMIAGTLAYMAPEQTGRMNRSITHVAISIHSASRFTRCLPARSRLLPLSRSNGFTVTSPGAQRHLESGSRGYPSQCRQLF